MSLDEKILTQKLTISKLKRRKIVVDEFRRSYTNLKNPVATACLEYIAQIPLYFNIKKPGQVKDLSNVSGLRRETLRRQFNVKAANKWFLLPKIYYGKVIHMLQNHLFGYIDTTRGNLHVSQYYDDSVDKSFFKFYNYIKTIHRQNCFPRNMYFYKKAHNVYISNQGV